MGKTLGGGARRSAGAAPKGGHCLAERVSLDGEPPANQTARGSASRNQRNLNQCKLLKKVNQIMLDNSRLNFYASFWLTEHPRECAVKPKFCKEEVAS